MRFIAFARNTTASTVTSGREVRRQHDVVVARERDPEVQHRDAEQRQDAAAEHLAGDLRRRRDLAEVVDRADDEHHAGREQDPERLRRPVEHLVELRAAARRRAIAASNPTNIAAPPSDRRRVGVDAAAAPGIAIAPIRGASQRMTNVARNVTTAAVAPDDRVAGHTDVRVAHEPGHEVRVGGELRAEAGGCARAPRRRRASSSARAQHPGDQLRDLGHLGLAHPGGRDRGRPEAQPARDERLLGIVRDRVLVAS